MGRAPCCDKDNVKKGPWSPEEDAKLKEYIEKNGTGGNWIALPQKIGLKRCGKSCRLRWLNYLRPNIKHGGFTEEEDNVICSLYISIGSRWSIIAAQLPGRTDNDIKNYWNTRLKKKLLGRRKQSNTSRLSGSTSKDQKDTNVVDHENSPLQNLSNSALERLQLHMQLQNLQNPFSFYNNPSLWPKLNPLQEKMLQVLQHSNESQIQVQIPPPSTTTHPGLGQNNLGLLDQRENSINGTSSTVEIPKSNVGGLQESGINHDQQPIATFTQDEIDNFLMNSKSPMVDFDCLKEINDLSRDNNLMWWSNEIHHYTNSASSNSWDSNSLLHQSSEGIYQDYALGYSL